MFVSMQYGFKCFQKIISDKRNENRKLIDWDDFGTFYELNSSQ